LELAVEFGGTLITRCCAFESSTPAPRVTLAFGNAINIVNSRDPGGLGEMRFRHFLARLEYRFDRSNTPVFIQDNYLFPKQLTVTLGLRYVIEPQNRFKPNGAWL
jgi:hypothetical protein